MIILLFLARHSDFELTCECLRLLGVLSRECELTWRHLLVDVIVMVVFPFRSINVVIIRDLIDVALAASCLKDPRRSVQLLRR